MIPLQEEARSSNVHSLLERMRSSRGLIAAGSVTLAAALFPTFYGGNGYLMSVATQCVIYGLITVTLNLLVGYGGLISLGHAGLLGVGAYTATLLLTHVGPIPLPLELLAAGCVTALVGFVLGLPAGRLDGFYLAMVTLGFGVAVPQLAVNLESITKGTTGLVVPPAQLGGTEFLSVSAVYYVSLVVVALCVLAIVSMLHTSTGRSFMAIRDREDAASAMGVNAWRTKVVLFTTSAFFTGIAGALYAHFAGLIAPSSFPLSLSLYFLAAVVIGGLASVWGSLFGAVILVVVASTTSSLGGFAPVILGGTVVLVLLVSPGGLAGVQRRLAKLLRRTRRSSHALKRSSSRGI